jgi:magnesium transporter
MSEVRTRAYRSGALEAQDFPISAVSDFLLEPDTVVWVDICDPSKNELDALAAELGLHELAVEDALDPHQRPKLDHYDTHLFLSCHAVRVDSGQLVEIEIDAFIHPRYLITVRKVPDSIGALFTQRWDRSPGLARHGVGYLLYGVLDVVVDGYFDAVEAFDEYYDQVSGQIFGGTPLAPEQQRNWFQMRQALLRLHRLTVLLREAVSALMRREQQGVAEDLYPYYQDVYDHVLRVSESTDALRDLVATIVESNLSLRDYRQNQIVKKVSSWAAIIAVPALVTGFYGMNVPYPGSQQVWGVVASSALMLGLSGVLYALFRSRDWL